MIVPLVLLLYHFNMPGVLMWTYEYCYWTVGDLLCVCARENSGEHWYSRPSKHVSPRRDQQRLTQAASCERSLKRPTSFLSEWASRPSKRGLA